MKKTTAERDPEAAGRLRELIRGIGVAMVTTVTSDGALRSRPMYTLDAGDAGELWFFVSDESEKVRNLAGEHAVNVGYADPQHDRYVSVSGNGSLVHDRDRIEDLWKPEFERFFPGGPENPHLALLVVRIETAEYWDATSTRMMPLQDLPGTNRGAGGRAGGEHTRVDIRATPASG